MERGQREAIEKIKELKKRDLGGTSQGAGKIQPGKEKVKEIIYGPEPHEEVLTGKMATCPPSPLWTRESRGLHMHHGGISVKYKEFPDMRNGK